MKEIACVGCNFHEIEAQYHRGLLGLFLKHSCKAGVKLFPLTKFQSLAPEYCEERKEGPEASERTSYRDTRKEESLVLESQG